MAGQRAAGSGPPVGVLAGARPSTLLVLVGLVLAALSVVEGLLLALGVLVTRVLAHGPVHRDEVAFEHAVLTLRTPVLDHVTRLGTVLGATTTVVTVTAAGCLLLAWRGHGPRLPAFLALAVAGETALFVLASVVLHRVRPPIPRLDAAPPTSSFPSGHTAATVALWGALALGLARTRPDQRLMRLSRCLAAGLPLFVLLTRLYRGMHWPSDVLASLVFTTAWLLLLRSILLPRSSADGPRDVSRGPAG